MWIQGFGEIKAVEVGHVDIQEEGIHLNFTDNLLGLDGTVALRDKFQIRNLVDIGNKFLER